MPLLKEAAKLLEGKGKERAVTEGERGLFFSSGMHQAFILGRGPKKRAAGYGEGCCFGPIVVGPGHVM